jgi:hypothetical protein
MLNSVQKYLVIVNQVMQYLCDNEKVKKEKED